MRIPDGLYTWNAVQPFGPSTPMLAEVSCGVIVHAQLGGETVAAGQLSDCQSALLSELRQRLIDADRFGARISRHTLSGALTWAG